MSSAEFFHLGSQFGTSLDGARASEAVTINGRSFLYVPALYSDTISIFEIFNNGQTATIGTVQDDATLRLDGVSGLIATEVNGIHYLYAASENDDSITVFQIATDGTLSAVQTIVDDATLELDLPFGEMSIAEAGGNRFLIVHGHNDDGISAFRIGADGRLTNTANVDNSGSTATGLDGAAASASITIGGVTYLYVSALFSDAVNIFELTPTGALVELGTVFDGGALELNGAIGLETVTIGTKNFLVVAGRDDSGLSVFEIGSGGSLVNVFNLNNTTGLGLSGARDVEVFELNGTTYVLTTGSYDDALAVFEMNAAGELFPVDAIFDSEDHDGLALNDTNDALFTIVDGQPLIIASGLADDGFSVFELGFGPRTVPGTEGADILAGSGRADIINGLAGDDVLSGQDGNDTLNGGEGNDVLSGGNDNDILIGDGDLGLRGSDSVTVAETGQNLGLSVSLPGGPGSSLEISGLVNRDANATSDFNIVYVVDVSGSMGSTFSGLETVGDENGDGSANQLLDGTILAYRTLNQSIINAGFGNADVSVVTFSSGAQTVYTGSVLSGVDTALQSLRDSGATNFEAALQKTIDALGAMGPGQNRVFFMSDGVNNTGGSFLDEVATLIDPNGLAAEITSIGLGNGASLADLDLVDDGISNNSAERVLEPSALTAGLLESPVDVSEVVRAEVYVNNTLRHTITSAEFDVTPLGLQYDLLISGVVTAPGDTIRVVLVASDAAATEVDVELTIPAVAPTAGDDTLMGGNGDDVLFGNGGDDVLVGDRGADNMRGGTGNDRYHVDSPFDVVVEEAGEGIDTIFTTLSMALPDHVENLVLESDLDLNGTGNSLANSLRGNDGKNTLTGLGGNDTLIADGGDDLVFGGTGNDFIGGGAGNDILRGDDGNDTIYGGLGDDNMAGGTGNDQIFGAAGANTIWGGLGNDTVQGGTGSDTIYGGGNGTNRLFGNDGNDQIFAGVGGDFIGGGAGNDTIRGADGSDTIYGGAGNDNIGGGAGNDQIFGSGGANIIWGGTGNDIVRGANGSDTIYGGVGNDDLAGGAGNDLIFGSTGANTIWGGTGNDTIHGGTGRDVMVGGPGADTFVFASAAHIGAGAGRDVISGFQSGLDRIDLSALNTQFNGTAGVLGGGQASFFYFASGGLLIGDQNGNGAADWVLELAGASGVTGADFLL